MLKIICNLRKSKKGATAIEYGLICALIAVAAIAAMTALGQSLTSLFSGIASTISDVAGSNP
jgi:pilus assembly protein Flp/PilA